MSIAATATMVLMLMLLAGFWILQTGLQGRLDYTESEGRGRRRPRGQRRPRQVQPVMTASRRCRRSSEVTFIEQDEALAASRARLAEQGEEDLTRYLESTRSTPASR